MNNYGSFLCCMYWDGGMEGWRDEGMKGWRDGGMKGLCKGSDTGGEKK